MSHFAKINNSNIVTEVIVSEQDFINSGVVGDSFLWVQTSYNLNFRKNFAKIGDTWDSTKNAFIPPKPYPSWTQRYNNDWKYNRCGKVRQHISRSKLRWQIDFH